MVSKIKNFITKKLAYLQWCNRGKPFGDDLKDWFQVEKKLERWTTGNILLWLLIYVFALTLLLFPSCVWLFVIAFFIIVIIGIHYNMQPATFLTILTVSIAAIGLSQQNVSLKTQIRQFQLDKRPYLFVDFIYNFHPRDTDVIFGAIMVFKNTGNFPASDVKANYLVADNISPRDYKKWYSDTYGGFPEITVVPPDNSPITVYAPGISKDATFACVGIIVTYRGFESNSKHWFKRLDIFRVKDEKGNLLSTPQLIENDIQWDQGENREPPQLQTPDWSKYAKSVE